jgi:hypothetical protein
MDCFLARAEPSDPEKLNAKLKSIRKLQIDLPKKEKGKQKRTFSAHHNTSKNSIVRPKEMMEMEKKSLFLRRTCWFIAIICVIGILHCFLATQAIRASIAVWDRDGDRKLSLSNRQEEVVGELPLSLALKRNQFLDTTPPTQIVVVGDALLSDAEYVAEVLKDAFGNTMTHLHSRISRHDLLEDAELQYVASRTDILWVVTVRSPCYGADSIIQSRKLYCKNEESLSDQCEAYINASEEDYYRIPWHDLHLSSDAHKERELNNSIIIKSKSEHKLRYDDIFDMRRRKLLLLKQLIDVVPRHAKILRLGEFELNPDAFVMDLVTEYNFKTRDRYNRSVAAIEPRNQSSFSCMGYSKWNDAQERIDWTLEGYFGHNRLDCHLCRHGQKNTTAIPSSIYLLGERNSGTTFVSNTLAKAFEPPNTMGSNAEMFASDIPVLLHKHMFRHDLLDSSELAEITARGDILWIMVVRSPCEW